MIYVVLKKTADPLARITFEQIAEADTIADAVDARESALERGGKIEILQRVSTLDAYAEAARQREPAAPPVYPAPDAAFDLKNPPPAKSRFERELDQFEAHEVKG